MHSLVANNLVKQFGLKYAIQNISFEATSGSVIGLLGHNGAGKTTLIRLLAGLLKPTAGSSYVDGLDPLSNGPLVRSKLGVLPSTTLVDERLTARQNLAFAGKIFNVPKPVADKRSEALLAQFGLEEAADSTVKGFSSGMKQRISLARVMLPNPPILLMDEPSSAIDPVGVKQLKELIRKIAAEGGLVVVSTHALDEATAMCDQVIILKQGQMLAQGKPKELADKLGLTGNLTIETESHYNSSVGTVLESFSQSVTLNSSSAVAGEIVRADVPKIVAELYRREIPLYRVALSQPSLEDIYFSLHSEEIS